MFAKYFIKFGQKRAFSNIESYQLDFLACQLHCLLITTFNQKPTYFRKCSHKINVGGLLCVDNLINLTANRNFMR